MPVMYSVLIDEDIRMDTEIDSDRQTAEREEACTDRIDGSTDVS